MLSRLLLLCAVIALSGCEGKAKWQVFRPAGGKFEIEMPGKPEHTLKRLDTEAGKVSLNLYSVERKRGHEAWMASFVDYPESATVSLDGIANAAAEGMGGTATDIVNIKIGEYPGQSFSFSGNSKGESIQGRGRTALRGHRLYQIVFLTQKDSFDAAAADRFLNSFKID